ncbi:MAG: PIN domain-containing protein [Acidobacteria bacterium]|nr:PIN domain-containing protein [Acidobacteriota bacterium]
MIAIDTSSFVAYLSGSRGRDVEAIDTALEHAQAVLPPVVLSELLSDPALPGAVKDLLKQLPLLDIFDGYWERAGLLRAKLLSKGRRAPLADSLIAQTCLDHDLRLVTRATDFRFFARHAGLNLL